MGVTALQRLWATFLGDDAPLGISEGLKRDPIPALFFNLSWLTSFLLRPVRCFFHHTPSIHLRNRVTIMHSKSIKSTLFGIALVAISVAAAPASGGAIMSLERAPISVGIETAGGMMTRLVCCTSFQTLHL
jgi:hypothetical protein